MREFKLSCPPIFVPDLPIDKNIVKLYKKYSENRFLVRNPVISVGMEQRYAMLVLQRNMQSSGAIDDNCVAKLRTLMVRPPIEPICYAFRNEIDFSNINIQKIQEISSALLGYKSRFRKNSSYSKYNNMEYEFIYDNNADKFIEYLMISYDKCRYYDFFPLYAFAVTVLCHPYENGNGRLARALMNIAIGKLVGIPYPIAPLSPTFYIHNRKIANEIINLSLTGDWNRYILSMSKIMFKLIDSGNTINNYISDLYSNREVQG